MKTVFIWPNTEKVNIGEAVSRCCALLVKMHAVILLPHEMCDIGVFQSDIRFVTPEVGVQKCDFIVSLGGDGTILRIAELAAKEGKPLIGINIGHVGFMTELEYTEIASIEKIFAGEYCIDNRMMLDLCVMRDGNELIRQTALNDVTITKMDPFRVIRLNIDADGVPVSSFSGDGVIIATPTGSTAYSLSAGGPIIEPSAENIAVTPVCAHNLYAKSFVFSPQRVISVSATEPDHTNVCASADGRNVMDLLPGDRISIFKSNRSTQLIRVKGKSFYDILREKLSDGGSAL